jgi:SpoVK/Ycf46/Vps4 family AAA+-type ATPase
VEQEITALVGMAAGKEVFDKMRKKVQYVEETGKKHLLSVCLNMVITGNPGVGKTTLARLMARFLHAYGVLPKDSFVERNGLELKGQFVGQSCPRVKEAIKDAMGGCLFIDEAYALVTPGSNDSFSTEVVRTLLTEVENNRTDVLVILAGYEDKMAHLLAADPGLPRRFKTTVKLADYTPPELALIAETAALDRFQACPLSPPASPSPSRAVCRCGSLLGCGPNSQCISPPNTPPSSMPTTEASQ